MGLNKLREAEKMHMHSEERPRINGENAHIYCLREEKLHLKSKFLKETVTVYHFSGGFMFIPNPLVKGVKNTIAEAVLTQFLYPPYRNSIDRSLEIEGTDLYGAYLKKSEITVKMSPNPVANIKIRQNPYASQEEKDAYASGYVKMPAEEIIKKIRWASLGIYYDWEEKAYAQKAVSPMPRVVDEVCQEISQEICRVRFVPETAVVNYYQKKDRIMSHIDRYEEDMTKPLISFSFGCSCVFVLGRKTREDPEVDTFLLQDGDIAVLIGDSREYFHGVPKIFEENTGREEYADFPFYSLISHSRINISVRQAYKHAEF
ncbi:alkylated DNA repair protein alkB-like protein 1 [Nematocida major]|uniref:alkylated DNA repair protein alkB-like protein 1 n=1 Tax=Nematocida major TaxID=1912982 RepID=UPI00200796D6|nr:alkylated DNA repair protein alkB-like protein 1 [Nematocida major]KAH9386928.1 alkylated DNA repair protein alkB-like protein 1 [Nematocida major]